MTKNRGTWNEEDFAYLNTLQEGKNIHSTLVWFDMVAWGGRWEDIHSSKFAGKKDTVLIYTKEKKDYIEKKEVKWLSSKHFQMWILVKDHMENKRIDSQVPN